MESRLHNYFLFSWPTTLSGMASILDLSGSSKDYNLSDSASKADYKAILDDWKAVGEDLKAAIKDVKEKAISS